VEHREHRRFSVELPIERSGGKTRLLSLIRAFSSPLVIRDFLSFRSASAFDLIDSVPFRHRAAGLSLPRYS